MAEDQLLTDNEHCIIELLPSLRNSLKECLAPELLARIGIDDLLQETFLLASKNFSRAKFENQRMLFGWLKQIAKRIAISTIRKRMPNSNSVSNPNCELASELLDSGEMTGSNVLSKTENREILRICLARLAGNHRRILELRYFEKLSFVSIASTLEEEEASVRGQHRNALAAIRRALGDVSKYYSSR